MTEVERGEKRQKLGGQVICEIIRTNVKIIGDNKFMRRGSSERQELISLNQ